MENPEEEKNKVEVNVEQDTVVDPEAPAQIIELDKKETKKEENAELKEAFRRLEAEKKRMEFHSRNLEKERRRLEELESRISNFRITTNRVEDPQDELDEIAQKDWKKAVRKLAEEEANRILGEREKQYQEQQKKNTLNSEVEETRQFVLGKYPSLSDDNSDEARIFMEVWNENPRYWANPQGYKLAMRDMEDKMREQGRILPYEKQTVDKEIARRARIGAGSLPMGRTGAKTNTYTLTQDQKAYCDHHGLKYEPYANTAKILESGEGLEA